MKNIYSNMRFMYGTVLSTLLLLVLSTNATAQIRKDFTQRTSSNALQQYVKPNTDGKIYNLRGDFKMAGNTNLTLTNYSDGGNNSSNLSYVDIDLDGSTINSSSSFLDIANDACTEIVYAGLYWSGRASTGNMSFNVSGNVQTPIGTTTQTINNTHNGTDNLNNTTVTINRSGSSNNYYPVQLVKIGDKEFEFTINNNGTVSKRERVNNGTWSGSTQVNVTVMNSLTNTNNITYSNVSSNTVETGNGNNRVQTETETSTATQTDENSGYKTFTLSTPIVYNYNSVNYTISSIRSYYTESSTRTSTATRTRTRDRWSFGWNPWSNWSNYSYSTWSQYSAKVYNASEANFRTPANNYVTITGPKTSTGTTTYNGTLTKNIVKFKKEGGTYQTVTALVSDIRYPNGEDGDMYAAYADVTEYVRNNKGGNYFVADIATSAGSSDNTGYYGGWGLVVIYANPTMKWRDITVFDGYAYVAGSTTVSHQLPISGFKAAQSGAINVDIGVMAGEGDRSIDGDYFQVLKKGGNSSTASDYINLGNSGSTGGFFNSNIATGSTKNPNLVNNTGIDIQRIALPNQAGGTNTIIGNNQTSTTFKYGSTQDTYIIFNIVFAVDAYVPETEVFAAITPTPGVDIANLQPGDQVTLTADIFNYGSDAIANGKLQINIPPGMQLVSASSVSNTQAASGASGPFNFNQPSWISPTGGSNNLPAAELGGILEWNLGSIPMQTLVNGNKVPMATLTYKLEVTDNCIVLQASENDCMLSPEIKGKIKGKGVNSGTDFEQDLITGYNQDCGNTPIYGSLHMEIKPSTTFLNNCSASNPVVNGVRLFKRFCSVANNIIPRADITNAYPAGTKFYTQAAVEITETNGFPVNPNGAITIYYAVLPGAPTACYLKLATQVEVIATTPKVANVSACAGEPIELDNQPSNTAYQLFYFQNQTDATPMNPNPAPTTAGVYTYYVAEGVTVGAVTCYGPKVPFTITINALPTAITLTNLELCTFADYTSAISANGATVVWEYNNGTTWVALTNQLTGVSVASNQLKITKAPAALNGTRFRVKSTNTNNCSSYSAEMTLTVKGCKMPVNPMIYTPLKR